MSEWDLVIIRKMWGSCCVHFRLGDATFGPSPIPISLAGHQDTLGATAGRSSATDLRISIEQG